MNLVYDKVEQEVRAAGMAIRDTWNDIVWLQTRIGILLEAAKVIGCQKQQPDTRVDLGNKDGNDLQVLEESQQIVQSLIVRLIPRLQLQMLMILGLHGG